MTTDAQPFDHTEQWLRALDLGSDMPIHRNRTARDDFQHVGSIKGRRADADEVAENLVDKALDKGHEVAVRVDLMPGTGLHGLFAKPTGRRARKGIGTGNSATTAGQLADKKSRRNRK